MSEVINFGGNVKELKEKIKQAGGLVVVDVFAEWCGSCQRLGQILPKIAEEFKNVTFIKIDVDKNEECGYHFDPTSLPCVYFLKADNSKEGYKIFDEKYGGNPQTIRECIEKYQ